MTTQDLKSGSVFVKIRWNAERTIKQITDTRVIFWANQKYKSSTGRQMTTEWESVKSFNKALQNGEYIIKSI